MIATVLNTVGSAEILRQVSLAARERLGEKSVVIFAAVADGKAVLMVAVGKQAQSKLNAGVIAKAAATVLGGGGGGKADFAQAGGTDPSKLEQALKVAKEQIS